MSASNAIPAVPTDVTNPTGGALATDLDVAATRSRQTARPSSPFRMVLAGGVDFLVRGASVATSVVAGPVMAAAVRDAGGGAAAALASPASGGRPGSLAIAGGASGSSTLPSSLASSGGDQSDLATAQAMQRESQVFNLQLLELQEDVQQENRRFTTVSNVLRAKHDTAKAALSNIRG